MAVTNQPRMIRDFLPRFQQATVVLIALLNLVFAAVVGGALYGFAKLAIDSVVLWGIVGGVFAIGCLIGNITAAFVQRPTRDLLDAVIHIAGEPSATPPPRPNDKRYENTGFDHALQTIYELASTDTPTPPVLELGTTNVQEVSPLSTALNNTLCGFVVLDHDRHVTYANKAAPVRITQQNQTTLELVFNGTDTLDAWLDECEQHAVHAERIWTRIPDKLPDQESRRLFDVMASYEKGTTSETVITLIDRTADYQQDEESLNFIAFAAHELRGPITVIRGYLDVLEGELEGVLQDDQQELFRRLTVSANRLSGYINNILNTSRYDRRHLNVHLNEDRLSAIYDTIRDDMQLRASAQNRLLSVDLPVSLPTIAADRASLGEVLGNLIDNAIKYSNEGGAIEVTAEPKGEFVEVSVTDHGIGMPGNVVSNLFQKFYRSHRSRETVSGTGIGLYISKAIIESHGGTISVRSDDGRGSVFTVALPIYAAVAEKLQAVSGNNEGLIDHGSGWIKNHSMFRS